MKLQKIESNIKATKLILLAVIGSSCISYTAWFYLINGQQLSISVSDWGSFGDFIGGIANPLIAFFAFYWLTQSVLIQKRELAETRKALLDSSESQKKQADIAFLSARLQTLNIHLMSINNEINSLFERRNIAIDNGYNGNIRINVMNDFGEICDPEQLIKDINQKIAKKCEIKSSIIDELNDIIKTM